MGGKYIVHIVINRQICICTVSAWIFVFNEIELWGKTSEIRRTTPTEAFSEE